MNITTEDLLLSEIQTLERFLHDLPKGQIIQRRSYESRLKSVRDRLDTLKASLEPSRVELTFKGEPVEGNRSIKARFGAKVLDQFVFAVEAADAGLRGSEATQGQLPLAAQGRLRLVGEAVGSYGFALELAPPAQSELDLGHDDPQRMALEKTLKLIQEFERGDEESVADIVAEIGPRAARNLSAFVKTVHKDNATFALAMDQQKIEVSDPEQLKRLAEEFEHLKEAEVKEVIGAIQGIRPLVKDFDAVVESGEGFSEKTDIQGSLASTSNEAIREMKGTWEGKRARLRLEVVTVKERRRFKLLGVLPLEDGAPASSSPPNPLE